jgi:hypothetical protein
VPELTPIRDRYDLVPGITAYRLSKIMNRVSAVLGALSVVTIIVFFVTVVTDRVTPERLVLVYAACALPMVAILVSAFATARRSRAESAAGYTTSTGGFQELDQVDPVTGVVIRRAGSAVLTIPGESSSTQGVPTGVVLNESSFAGLRFVETRRARRAKLLTFVGLGVFAVAVLGLRLEGQLVGRNAADQVSAVATFAYAIGGVAVFVGILLLASSGFALAREKAAAAAQPFLRLHHPAHPRTSRCIGGGRRGASTPWPSVRGDSWAGRDPPVGRERGGWTTRQHSVEQCRPRSSWQAHRFQ